MKYRRLAIAASILLLGLLVARAGEEDKPPKAEKPKPPFSYVWGKAYHVLPETHNDESGYFSLCEGLDGSIYVGTSKEKVNSYLVEFDPRTERQRIVIDTHKVCGLTATGYAAQGKMHTRNFVGPSGKIYVGSMQGHKTEGRKEEYPGGYVMTYDPRIGVAESLGMPFPGEGVIDVVADEGRGVLYAVSFPEGHWMRYDVATKTWRELGPRLTGFASTLIDGKGRANAITKDFQLAQYDPATDKATVRPIQVDDKTLEKPNVPEWRLAPNGRSACLIQLDDPTLYEIDLYSEGDAVSARSHGKMIEGAGYDSRGAVSIGPDGRLYAVVRVTNETGFGGGYLHHLLRFDPKTKKTEDLGVVAVKNPDFFNFGPDAQGNKPPFSHGFHTLPDGTLTPMHVHLAMTVTADNTIYVTILYPFTLLKIDQFKQPERPAESPAEQYVDFALTACERVAEQVPDLTRVGEAMAKRHLAGGMIGFVGAESALTPELDGRSGGIMHVDFDRCWKKDRTEREQAMDMAIVELTAKSAGDTLKQMQAVKARGGVLIGFGPRRAQGIAQHVKLCDAFFDNGFGDDDRLIKTRRGRTGDAGMLVDTLFAWALIGEHVAALTREGKMPIMAKSWLYDDGRAWWDQYFQKGAAFHDEREYKIAPVPPGKLAGEFLDRMRWHLRRFRRYEIDHVHQAGLLIADELAKGRKTNVAFIGHLPYGYLCKGDDVLWATKWDMYEGGEETLAEFRQKVPAGSLTMRLGYAGLGADIQALFVDTKQRVILIAGEHTSPEFQLTDAFKKQMIVMIDLGYAMGDSCVPIEGYPFRIIPPSGIMQLLAYRAVDAEVQARR